MVALVHEESGDVRAKVVTNVNGTTLPKVLSEHADPATTHLHTDSSRVYRELGPSFVSHDAVNHKAGEYVRGNVSTNMAESFFSQFKRGLDGTHHNVSKGHLHRYTTEFEFRRCTAPGPFNGLDLRG